MLLNLSYLLSALAATGICVLTGGFSGFGTVVLWLACFAGGVAL